MSQWNKQGLFSAIRGRQGPTYLDQRQTEMLSFSRRKFVSWNSVVCVYVYVCVCVCVFQCVSVCVSDFPVIASIHLQRRCTTSPAFPAVCRGQPSCLYTKSRLQSPHPMLTHSLCAVALFSSPPVKPLLCHMSHPQCPPCPPERQHPDGPAYLDHGSDSPSLFGGQPIATGKAQWQSIG